MALIDELRRRRKSRDPQVIEQLRRIPAEQRLTQALPYACVMRGESVGQITCGVGLYPCYEPDVPHEQCVVSLASCHDADPSMVRAVVFRSNLAICETCKHRRSRRTVPLVESDASQTWPTFRRQLPPQDITHWTHQLSGFQPSAHHLNGAVFEVDGRTLLVYRWGWDSPRLHCAELDDEWSVVKEKDVTLPTNYDNHVGQEDPRVFWWNGRLMVAYTGVHRANGVLRTSVMLGELDEFLDPVRTWTCDYPRRRNWEKNWGFLPYGDELYAIYDIQPHRVLRLTGLDDATAKATFELVHEEEWDAPLETGLMRGGASPQLWQGEWYSFAHGVYRHANTRHYQLCAYTMQEEPPFRPLRVVNTPLLTPHLADRPSSHMPHCVYPCGAIRRGRDWIVSYGYYDTWTRLAAIDGNQLEQRFSVLGGDRWGDVQLPAAHDHIHVNIWKQVYHGNEYRLPSSFEADDIIVDVGANIGAFSAACLARGAGEVVAYEPRPRYGDCWHANLEKLPGTRTFIPRAKECHLTEHADVDTDPFPDRPIRLLKLDCEGSEFTILRRHDLHQVQEICGEGHDWQGTRDELEGLLRWRGFEDVHSERNGDTTWLFWGRRR